MFAKNLILLGNHAIKQNMPQLARTLQPTSYQLLLTNQRGYASEDATYGIATYEEIKKLQPKQYLIDVREHDEVSDTGLMPHSINIPLAELKNTLADGTSDKHFKGLFKRDKPELDAPLIFSCKSGVRSAKAALIAKELGFKDVKSYKGSWTEWAKRQLEDKQ